MGHGFGMQDYYSLESKGVDLLGYKAVFSKMAGSIQNRKQCT